MPPIGLYICRVLAYTGDIFYVRSASLALSFGTLVEVVSPPGLRTLVGQWLTEMVQIYDLPPSGWSGPAIQP
jgi:hypothetical protein